MSIPSELNQIPGTFSGSESIVPTIEGEIACTRPLLVQVQGGHMKGQSFPVPLLMSLASADWIQCFQLLPRLLLSVLLLALHWAQHIGPVMS